MFDLILLALLCLIVGGAIVSWICAALDKTVTGMIFLIISGASQVAFGLLGAGSIMVGLIQNPPCIPGAPGLTTQLWASSILGLAMCLCFAALGTWTIRMSVEALGLIAD